MSKPLESFRVLDLTNVLAGPFCCHQLAHMGAEVIKVEAVGRGDLARQLGGDLELSNKNMGASFLAQNAGKKSVTVNLKHPEGKALFLKLVKTADVVVENFRPGVMHRLGVGYEVLKEIRPEIIYCAISGFGQEGPWVHRPAYDQIIQGTSGVMSITGDAGKRAAAGGLSSRRHGRRRHGCVCHLCGAQWQSSRNVYRRVNAGINAGDDGLGGF